MPSPTPSTKAKAANVNEHTWKRRAFHLCAALVIPIVALALGYKAAFYTAAIAAAVFASGEALRLCRARGQRSSHRMAGSADQAAREAEPHSRDVPRARVAGRAVPLRHTAGDAGAGVYGAGRPRGGHCRHTRYGRLRVRALGQRPGGKSVEGTLAFLGVSAAAATGLWAAGVYGTLWPALVGAAVAAIVEFLPIPVEDNVTVPLASAAVMWLLWVG